MKNQIKELQKQLLNSQIDNHFLKNPHLNPEMLKVVKIIGNEQATYSDDGSRTFKDTNGKTYHDTSIWIESLAETEKLPLVAQTESNQAEQPTRLCKNDMTEAQKREFKKLHGYKKYNDLPLNNVAAQ